MPTCLLLFLQQTHRNAYANKNGYVVQFRALLCCSVDAKNYTCEIFPNMLPSRSVPA